MKIIKLLVVMISTTTIITLFSCGAGTLSNLKTTDGTTNATSLSKSTSSSETQSSVAGELISSLLGGSSNTESSTSSLLTGVIGSLLDGTKSASIIGTWNYSEPSVEFESSNLLAKAGGTVAANQIVSKISPYYEKLGLKQGKFSITFKEDKTCVVNINGKSQTASYAYNSKDHTLKITGQNLGLSFGTAYATVSSTQLSLTFDSTKLMNLAQSVASASNNTTLTTLSSLSSSFEGMKTGFKFTRSK